MNRKLILILLLGGLLAARTAWAQEDEFTLNGKVGIGTRGINVDGGRRNGADANSGTCPSSGLGCFAAPVGYDSRDEAKASEYRDLNSGMIGIIDVEGSSQRNYIRFFGENFGHDDEYLNLRGGQYGEYKYRLYLDKMPHNLSWDARTPMTGTGDSTLGGTRSINSSGWNTFNYSLQRKDTGAMAEWTGGTPWHVRTDYNEVSTKGIRPLSGRLGTSSSFGFEEFGAPVDYKTKNFVLETGFSTKRGNIAVSFLNSRFNNATDQVQWPNFYLANQLDTSLLPPDSDMKRYALNGSLRQLPMSSTFSARLTYTQLTNNFNVASTGLLPNVAAPSSTTTTLLTPAQVATATSAPSSPNFNGDHKTRTATFSLTSTLAKGLDSRLFYNYYNKVNNSTPISYAASTGALFVTGAVAANTPFAYKKLDYGADLGYRLNAQNKISGGAGVTDTHREGRDDADRTKDTKLWTEYKNNTIESLTGRLKYQYVKRDSELNPAITPSGTANPGQVAYYYRAYDVSNYDQHQAKLVLDWSAMPRLDVGLESAAKRTYYKELYYGRKNDRRIEENLTVSYGDPKSFRVTGLLNYEHIVFDQAYHQGTGPFPGGTQTPTDFDWGTRNSQSNRLAALIADWVPMSRLALRASYAWSKTAGGVEFDSGNTAGAGGFNGGPLVNYVTDNTTKTTFNLKGDYHISPQWTGTLGFVHEKYKYNDDQMQGYQGFYPFYQNLGGQNQSWLTGAYANPSYTMKVVYLTMTYAF